MCAPWRAPPHLFGGVVAGAGRLLSTLPQLRQQFATARRAAAGHADDLRIKLRTRSD